MVNAPGFIMFLVQAIKGRTITKHMGVGRAKYKKIFEQGKIKWKKFMHEK